MAKKLLLLTLFSIISLSLYAISKYDVREFYSLIQPDSGTKAVGSYDNVVDVKYILIPTRLDTGKYAVDVKKIGDNLYQIIGTDICIETRYCYEYTGYSEEVVLIIESNYGYTKGEVIFD